MIVMDKYYIPEIEEFHVGFRCERRATNYPDKVNWVSDNVSGWRDRVFDDLRMLIYHDTVRVKYLDRDDIEELGWVRNDEDDRMEHVAFAKGDHNMYFSETDREVVITYDWGSKFADTVWGDISAQNTCFVGTCKNYNELKRIMKQIGI